jgi:hypothetical protein
MSHNHRLRKLDQAVKLTSINSDNDIEDIDNFKKGITLFEQLCMSNNLTPDDKLDVLVCYLKACPESAKDMIYKWRDMIPFLEKNELNDVIDLLCKITRCSEVDSHERMTTAVTLYNNCFLHVCYNCFIDIACDRSILVTYRIDSCRYLFGTQDPDYKQISQESLLEIIDTTEYPSEFRYKIIAGFISKTGINTYLNYTKLKIPYDEEFVYGLQTNFFYNDKNGVRDRILSGQHLLQMELVESREKEEVGETLLNFAEDAKNDENTRADAGDVIFRLGTSDQKKRARTIITDLGFSTTDSHKIGVGSLMDRTKSIYSDSQNIHQFQSQIDKFIEKIINETEIKILPFHEVHNEVINYLRIKILDKKVLVQSFKALNRISIDTARFTSHKVTLAEIFVHIWARIIKYDSGRQEELKKRMMEELIDMGDTCSSGHSGRFVNILSEVDISLKISWEEQILSNMAGRMLARIRDCPNSDTRASLAMAESELADDEDKIIYKDFIKENLTSLRKELYKEFVNENYVTEEEFNEAFNSGVKKWL